MQSTPRFAVITAAGSGTRMWPATKVVPKELFPLGRMPTLVRVVWEMLDAGVREIVLVVTEQSESSVRRLFDPSSPAPANVRDDPEVQRFEKMLAATTFHVVRQVGPYGNGTPLLSAADLVGDETCVYAFGDDVIFGENATANLLRVHERTGTPVLAAQQVEPERTKSFGILECTERNGIQFVRRLIEKPAPGETSSTLAAFGRYLVTPDVLNQLRNTKPGKGGELWFVDAVIRRMQDGREVCAAPLTAGRWLTVGDPRGYADAVKAASDGLPR
jgi:UTP--glucose-1-phosphate uridylyltransferase